MVPEPAERVYIAIDLKSFYASVECVALGKDPLTTNLVVADVSRTEKTICLAVTPSLKSFGISGRARLFEVVQRVKEVNAQRRAAAPGGKFRAKSSDYTELMADPSLELSYIAAKPRMAKYMEVSTQIFNIYMRYVSSEDIHVYSVDEVFIDATAYLKLYGLSARDFAMKLVREVLAETGITATAGIGTNMYLCKIAMDIVAKRMPADKDGVRIAELDEMSYRKLLWDHTPITDFWRVGKGYARRLAKAGLYTMGDIARSSVHNEDLLYKMFGVNAELLIDHAWGWEPCRISDIKGYTPESSSISSGQVLSRPYSAREGLLIAMEMADSLALDLVRKRLMTDQMVLTVCYDTQSLEDPAVRKAYKGPVSTDWYGREVPKEGHGSMNLNGYTSSGSEIIDAVAALYKSVTDERLLVRRLYVVANRVLPEGDVPKLQTEEQLDIFSMVSGADAGAEQEEERGAERARQEAVLKIREKFGKNAIVRGMDLQDAATAMDRNAQVGGHKA